MSLYQPDKTPTAYIRSARVLDGAGSVIVRGLGGKPVSVKPAMIELVRSIPDTTLSLIDASTVTIGDPPERIVDLVVQHPRRLRRGAWAYTHVKYALESGRSPQELLHEHFDAVIASVTAPVPVRSGLRRLVAIYGELLSPFLVPFKIFRRTWKP